MLNDESAAPASRVRWMDGLRGVAAFQVVLLHAASAFLPGVGLQEPALAHYKWEAIFIRTPAYFILDGFAAVNIFFLLSGAALTFSFGRQSRGVAANLGRRIVRLGLPMCCGLILGVALYSWLPNEQLATSELTRSAWLRWISPPAGTVGTVLHQMVLEGMATGYLEYSMLPHWLASHWGLCSLASSYDAPLWTLHIEFLGSILILILVWSQASFGRLVNTGLILLAFLFLLATPLVAFLIGHVASRVVMRPSRGMRSQLFGFACVAGGVVLCTVPLQHLDAILSRFLSPLPDPGPPPIAWGGPRGMLGSVLVFLGVAHLTAVRTWLERPSLQWFGRVSFSLYLVHFPIMATVGSGIFVMAYKFSSYGGAAFLACASTIVVSLAAADVFARKVDGPAIRLSRWVGTICVPRLVRRAP